jgi:hypothetical protein
MTISDESSRIMRTPVARARSSRKVRSASRGVPAVVAARRLSFRGPTR